MLVAPAPVSSAASVIPTTFAAWVAQGPSKYKRICAVYISFTFAKEYKVGECLKELALSDIDKVPLGVCLET